MKSIMIIAGDKTEKLADFFTERGAFSVDYAYNSLSTNVVQIRDAIINVDKLLYVYQDGINIKADMQVLKESLSSGAFFTVKEMVFVTSDDEESTIARKYFNAVIESTGFSNYEIKIIAGRLTFAGIYDTVLGISVDANVKNTFKTVYRVERGDKAKKAFIPTDDSNLLIEPFDNSNQLELENRKTNIINTESGIPRKDQSTGTNIETYFNPILTSMSTLVGRGRVFKPVEFKNNFAISATRLNRLLSVSNTLFDIENYVGVTTKNLSILATKSRGSDNSDYELIRQERSNAIFQANFENLYVFLSKMNISMENITVNLDRRCCDIEESNKQYSIPVTISNLRRVGDVSEIKIPYYIFKTVLLYKSHSTLEFNNTRNFIRVLFGDLVLAF